MHFLKNKGLPMLNFGSGCLVGALCAFLVIVLPMLYYFKCKVNKLNRVIETLEKHTKMESLSAIELLELGRNGYYMTYQECDF